MRKKDVSQKKSRFTEDKFIRGRLVQGAGDVNVHISTGDGSSAEMVTRERKIKIIFRYPLCKPTQFTFENTGGFTLESFARAVLTGYLHIYHESELHGVWGHGLDDLHLERIQEIEPTDGVARFEISVGS